MGQEIVKFDPKHLEVLGITEQEAKDLLADGVSLEEYAAMIGADLKETAENTDKRPVKIKIVHAAQAFQFEATGEIKQELQMVVPYFHKVRGLFKKDQKQPICSSLDGKTGNYQAADGTWHCRDCSECPWNQWGTAVDDNGEQKGNGKACKEMRRIFVLEPGRDFPAVLHVPPTSIKIWDEFISGCNYQKMPVTSVVLKVGLDKQQSGANIWSTIKQPTIARKLSPVEYVKIRKMKEEFEMVAKSMGVQSDDYYEESNVVENEVNNEEHAS